MLKHYLHTLQSMYKLIHCSKYKFYHYHSFMIILFLVIIVTGFFKPTIRKWYSLALGFCAYIAFALFLLQVCEMPSAMYITKPILSGTHLYWYVLAPLAGLIYFSALGIMYLVRYLIDRKKQQHYARI